MQTVIELLKAVFLGIVQGITEWLPISSTGHMILANEIISLSVSDAFMEMFEVVIQLGSILAVVVLFFHKLNPFSPKSAPQKRETFSLWGKVLIGVIPAGIIGLLFDDQINDIFYNSLTIAITLIIYGVLFILVENRNKGRAPPRRLGQGNNLAARSGYRLRPGSRPDSGHLPLGRNHNRRYAPGPVPHRRR